MRSLLFSAFSAAALFALSVAGPYLPGNSEVRAALRCRPIWQNCRPFVLNVDGRYPSQPRRHNRLNVNNYGGGKRVEPQDWVDDLPELKGIANIIVEDQRAPSTVQRPRKT